MESDKIYKEIQISLILRVTYSVLHNLKVDARLWNIIHRPRKHQNTTSVQNDAHSQQKNLGYKIHQRLSVVQDGIAGTFWIEIHRTKSKFLFLGIQIIV